MSMQQGYVGYFGLAGAVVILLTSVVTAIAYKGRDGESYSPLNHFVSELGERGVSRLAAVFNAGLISGGLMLALFMAGLGIFLNEVLGYLAAAIGFLTGVSCSLVGALPMNNLRRHIPVALSFFYSGLLSISFFSIFIVTSSGEKLPPWLLVPSLVVVGSFAGFLFLTRVIAKDLGWMFDPSKIKRPGLWSVTILEWSVFISLMAWVLCVSFYLILVGS